MTLTEKDTERIMERIFGQRKRRKPKGKIVYVKRRRTPKKESGGSAETPRPRTAQEKEKH